MSPSHAATVLLLREQHGEVQVLMTQRHANLNFMGGMWVFPGGALSPADSSDAAIATLVPGSHSPSCARLETAQGERLSQRECVALAIAACRETFEETGVLLARHTDGSACAPELIERLQDERRCVVSDAAAFATMLHRESLHLDIARLIYWSHWITPSGATRRFDTRFFAIAAPASQTATVDLSEASALAWMSPRELLAQARSGAMPIVRPTIYNLEDLRASVDAHATLDELFATEANRAVVPILPKLFRDEGQNRLLMPWDENYATAPGEGTAPGLTYPEALRRLVF